MAYFNSTEVTVFPTTSRVFDPTGKFTSEHNFINILNSLIDHNLSDEYYSVSGRVLNDGCVLKYYTGTAFSDVDVRANKFCFIIHGYYFELPAQPTGPNTYFGICVSNNDQLLGFENNSSLDGIPSGQSVSKFFGLFKQINVGDPSTLPAATRAGATNYWLRITDSDGNLVNTVKLKSDSIEYTRADGTKTEVQSELRHLNSDKQDNLIEGNGLNVNGAHIKIQDNLYNYIVNLMNTTIGSSDLEIMKVNNGIFSTNALSKGGYLGDTRIFRHIYVNNGVITEGQTIYASQQGATDDSVGNDGDIWYKYS